MDDASGTTVWGAFRKDYADPKTAEGAQLISLPLNVDNPMTYGAVRPDGVLEDLKLKIAGIPISIQAYAGILNTLGVGGYLDETLGMQIQLITARIISPVSNSIMIGAKI